MQRLFEKLFHQRDSLNSSTLKNRAENFIGFGIVDETLVVENPFDAKHENEGNAHEAVGEEEANKISQHETEQSNEGYAQESFPGEDQDGVDAESFENEETSPQS